MLHIQSKFIVNRQNNVVFKKDTFKARAVEGSQPNHAPYSTTKLDIYLNDKLTTVATYENGVEFRARHIGSTYIELVVYCEGQHHTSSAPIENALSLMRDIVRDRGFGLFFQRCSENHLFDKFYDTYLDGERFDNNLESIGNGYKGLVNILTNKEKMRLLLKSLK
jgi:hypothetical protein